MATLSSLRSLDELVSAAIEKHNVPAASAAVYYKGEIYEASAGLLNTETRVSATPDSLFMLASITKAYTATLAMQLVDEGRLDLEGRVIDYLPDFRVADRRASEEIRIWHLLSHTSGIDGDFYLDTGRNPDCLEKYVAACDTLPQLHEPGALYSYCNAGIGIAGRVLEVQSGKYWRDLFEERLVAPLGLNHTTSNPDMFPRFRVAIGHEPKGSGGQQTPLRKPYTTRALECAGTTCFSSAGDLARFAALHLENGVTQSGARILSEQSVRQMQTAAVKMGDLGFMTGWGMGWLLDEAQSPKIIGHDGGGLGQAAMLRMIPEHKLAVCVMTNTAHGHAAAVDILAPIFKEATGYVRRVRKAKNPLKKVKVNLDDYVGRYGRTGAIIHIEKDRGGLACIVESLPQPDIPAGKTTFSMRPIDTETFELVEMNTGHVIANCRFYQFENGRPNYVLAGIRIHRRLDQ